MLGKQEIGKQEIFLQNVMLKNTQRSMLEKTENRAGFCGSPLDGVTQLEARSWHRLSPRRLRGRVFPKIKVLFLFVPQVLPRELQMHLSVHFVLCAAFLT